MGQPEERLFIYRNQTIGRDTINYNLCQNKMWLQNLQIEKIIITKPPNLSKNLLQTFAFENPDIYYDGAFD